MSDTNQVSLRWAAESELGVTPVSPPLFEAKFSGTSDMGATPETVVSEIIRSDRQVNDLILVNQSVGGQFDSELLSTVHNSFLQAVLQSDAAFGSGTVLVAAGPTVTITTDSPVTGQSTIDETGAFGSGIADGDWVEVIQGSAEPSYYRVVDVPDADSIVVEGVVSETTGTDIGVATGPSVTNGSTLQSFTFERAFNDHAATTYEYLRGMVPGTFSLTASASSIVNCAFGFTGMTHDVTETREPGASEVDLDGFTFNASSNVATLGEGGSPGLQIVTEFSLEVDNNLRELNAIGILGASGIGSGEFNVTGSLQTYFEDKSLLEKLLSNEQTSVSLGFSDGSGTTIIFDLPAIKFSEGVPEVSGKNEDVMLNLGFQAFRDSVLGYTMKVTLFTA